MTTLPQPAKDSSSAPHGGWSATGGEWQQLLREAAQIRGISLWQDAWRRLRRNKPAMLSLGYLCVLGLAALFAPLLPLPSPKLQDTRGRQFQPPSLTRTSLELAALTGDERERQVQRLWHDPNWFDRTLIRLRVLLCGDFCVPSLCGADHLGRDLLARIFYGARVSLSVGLLAACVSLLIGVTYGAIAGYLGGWVDAVLMRIVDVLYSVPFIFVVIFIITLLNDDEFRRQWLDPLGIDKLTVLYLVIGAIYWLTMSRVVRGQVLSLKQELFVEAARAAGAGRRRIIFLHLVPNCLGVVIVYLTLTIPSVMLFEAFLSFLGLGVEPPNVSWGLLAHDAMNVITPIRTRWWLVFFPGLALAFTLLALNFLGDGLRDGLDPKLKNKG